MGWTKPVVIDQHVGPHLDRHVVRTGRQDVLRVGGELHAAYRIPAARAWQSKASRKCICVEHLGHCGQNPFVDTAPRPDAGSTPRQASMPPSTRLRGLAFEGACDSIRSITFLTIHNIFQKGSASGLDNALPVRQDWNLSRMPSHTATPCLS